MRDNPKLAAQIATRWIPGLEARRRGSCDAVQHPAGRPAAVRQQLSALCGGHRITLHRLGVIKSTFDVNKHIEPKYILNVMARNPELFSDLPAIPADVAIKPGYVFKP